MDEKLSIYDIAEILTAKTGREKADIETFIETLIAVINDVITHNGVVRIKGIGSFKVIPVKERESIHVNTGERIVIPAHHKLSFLPDKILKEKINRPFAFSKPSKPTKRKTMKRLHPVFLMMTKKMKTMNP